MKDMNEICGFVLMMLILLVVQSGSASDYPDFVGYVNDYAHLLSAPQASTLNQELRDFDNRTTIEVAVVTVDSIGSKSPQDYATNIANYWGVGKRDKNNGILFLVAMQSHDIWIEVGSGLAGQFSDSQVQQIVDNVIIPRFRAGQPDLGVIDGVHSIIGHFEGSSISQTKPTTYAPQDISNSNFNFNFNWLAVFGVLGAVCLVFFRQFTIRKNKVRIDEYKKALENIVDKETTALDALKELKANYAPPIWKSVDESFNLVDHQKLELDILAAERYNRGLLSPSRARSQIYDMEDSFENAKRYTEAPINKLAEVKNAQQECPAILAGLEGAFLQAEKETGGTNISMATRMNLETARHNYQEAVSLSEMPANEVDWIALLDRLIKIREAVEQVSKDAVRDRAIAEKIQGQNPDELLDKMKQTLDEAENSVGKWHEARPDLEAARKDYERAKGYRSGDLNTIDLYLILNSINRNIEMGHQHHQKAIEESRLAQERATPVHHTGFGSSGSRSFGGGRMGGGSRGGGKW